MKSFIQVLGQIENRRYFSFYKTNVIFLIDMQKILFKWGLLQLTWKIASDWPQLKMSPHIIKCINYNLPRGQSETVSLVSWHTPQLKSILLMLFCLNNCAGHSRRGRCHDNWCSKCIAAHHWEVYRQCAFLSHLQLLVQDHSGIAEQVRLSKT